jgi:hypothetical protein
MNNAKFRTQIQLMDNHLDNIGSINTDEARILYSIVDVPATISRSSRPKSVVHKQINRPHPVTGRIRGIVEYSREKSNAE